MKTKLEKLKSVTPDTWARTICLVIALVNQALVTFGKDILPVAENDVYQLVSLIATIGTGLAAWWKNNSFTSSAVEADRYMRQLKLGYPSLDEDIVSEDDT